MTVQPGAVGDVVAQIVAVQDGVAVQTGDGGVGVASNLELYLPFCMDAAAVAFFASYYGAHHHSFLKPCPWHCLHPLHHPLLGSQGYQAEKAHQIFHPCLPQMAQT